MSDESKALTVRGNQAGTVYVHTVDEALKLGTVLAKSGFFKDIKEASQAVVKVLTGQELGFGPMASMAGVYVQNGRTSFSANLIASAIKRNGYDYNIVKLDNTTCELEFLDKSGKARIPHVVFTFEDAVTAGLTTGVNAHSWKHYPKNMVFARAISNLAKWFCPEIFGGTTPYTPDELDIVIDGESGEVIVSDSKTVENSKSVVDSKATSTEAETTKSSDTEETKKEDDGKITLWDGKTRRSPQEMISIKSINWIVENFVGDVPPKIQKTHLKNHLRSHFNVDNLNEMTWEKALAFVNHFQKKGDDQRWYKPDEDDPVLKAGKDLGAIISKVLTPDSIMERARNLRPEPCETLNELVQACKTKTANPETGEIVYGGVFGGKSGVSELDEHGLELLSAVLDTIEKGSCGANDLKAQKELVEL